jgi:hypothetical protein
MVACVINDELEGSWKEEVEAKFRYAAVTSIEELRKIMQNLGKHFQ